MNDLTKIRNNQEALQLLEPGWVIVKRNDIVGTRAVPVVDRRSARIDGGTTGEVLTRIDDYNFAGHRDWLPPGAITPPPPTVILFTELEPPPNPVDDQLWYDTDNAKLYLYYVDGTAPCWIQIN